MRNQILGFTYGADWFDPLALAGLGLLGLCRRQKT
jgi:hypothetical protein